MWSSSSLPPLIFIPFKHENDKIEPLFLCFFSLTFWQQSQIIIIFTSSCYRSFQTWRWRHRAIIFVFFLYGLHHFVKDKRWQQSQIIIIFASSYFRFSKTWKWWHKAVVFVSFVFSYEKQKTTKSWLSSISNSCWCYFQRESNTLLCLWCFEKGRKFNKWSFDLSSYMLLLLC